MTKYICALLLSLGWCGSAISSVNAAVTDQAISKPLNEEVSVAGQMDLVKFQQLLKQGFKSVIVNRPDGEVCRSGGRSTALFNQAKQQGLLRE